MGKRGTLAVDGISGINMELTAAAFGLAALVAATLAWRANQLAQRRHRANIVLTHQNERLNADLWKARRVAEEAKLVLGEIYKASPVHRFDVGEYLEIAIADDPKTQYLDAPQETAYQIHSRSERLAVLRADWIRDQQAGLWFARLRGSEGGAVVAINQRLIGRLFLTPKSLCQDVAQTLLDSWPRDNTELESDEQDPATN